MAVYSIEVDLPCIHVDVSLLKAIENYCRKEIWNMLPAEVRRGNKSIYKLQLHDLKGVESLDSIAEYKFRLLPNHLEALQISFSDSKDSFDIELNLEQEEVPCLSVSLESKSPREIVYGIEQGITNLVNDSRNGNEFFHPRKWIEALVILPALGFGLYAFLFLLVDEYQKAFGPGMITLSAISYSILGSKIRTPVSFATRKYNRLNRYFKWFISGLFSFIIFGTIFTFFRTVAFEYVYSIIQK